MDFWAAILVHLDAKPPNGPALPHSITWFLLLVDFSQLQWVQYALFLVLSNSIHPVAIDINLLPKRTSTDNPFNNRLLLFKVSLGWRNRIHTLSIARLFAFCLEMTGIITALGWFSNGC